jgi:hypothetical protein
MISGLKASLSNSEKQRKLMLMNSDVENLMKEKIDSHGLVKERITEDK